MKNVSTTKLKNLTSNHYDKYFESLIRLLYREHIHNQDGKISNILKKISQLEETIYDMKIICKETAKGWKAAA
jgi:hypothetical protein